jgi:hypothetical protein
VGRSDAGSARPRLGYVALTAVPALQGPRGSEPVTGPMIGLLLSGEDEDLPYGLPSCARSPPVFQTLSMQMATAYLPTVGKPSVRPVSSNNLNRVAAPEQSFDEG